MLLLISFCQAVTMDRIVAWFVSWPPSLLEDEPPFDFDFFFPHSCDSTTVVPLKAFYACCQGSFGGVGLRQETHVHLAGARYPYTVTAEQFPPSCSYQLDDNSLMENRFTRNDRSLLGLILSKPQFGSQERVRQVTLHPLTSTSKFHPFCLYY